MTRLITICTFMIFAGSIQAQTLNAYIKAAEEAIKKKDNYSALVYYQNAMEIESGNLKYIHKAAEAARGINSITLAEKYYKQVVDMDGEGTYPDAAFYLAQVQQQLGKYDTAQLNYQLYISEHEGENPTLTAQALKEAESCEYAQGLVDNPWEEYEIIHLDESVNSPHTDFGATIYHDSLYYSSLRFENNEDEYDPDRPFTGLLVWQDGDSMATELGTDINQKGRHIANTAFTPDYSRIYYTICEYKNGEDIRCDLYYSDVNSSGWGDPVMLPAHINDTAHTSTHPNVAVDKNSGDAYLYYISNREGGKGKMDIWRVAIVDTGFSQPVNMEALNTPRNEVSPFYHQSSGVLYFSSEGHLGMGGYDVYRSNVDDNAENGFGKVEHLGYPLNTSYNEIYYVLKESGDTAFLSTNRPGSFYLDDEVEACCYDIYKVNINAFADLIAMTFDAETMDSLYGASMTLIDLSTPGRPTVSLYDPELAKQVFPLARNKEYLLIADKPGFYPDSARFNTVNEEAFEDVVKKLFLKERPLEALVNVFDAQTREPLIGAQVQLLDVTDEDNPIVVAEDTNKSGNQFVFPLERDKVYRVIASRKGYKPATTIIDTRNMGDQMSVERNLYLEIGDLSNFLPLALFFDNDHPNPRSNAEKTDVTYSETYPQYLAKQDEFISRFVDPLTGEEKIEGNRAMAGFFTTEVKKGNDDLAVFLNQLKELLDSGSEIEIYLKGYTSPLASSAYNLKLGYRRVWSVLNEFREYENGVLEPYLDSGQLKVELQSFGETDVPSGISDKLSDLRNSVFSIRASKERRVEIIQVDVTDRGE